MDGKVTMVLLVAVLVIVGLGVSVVSSGYLPEVLDALQITVEGPRLTVTWKAPGMPAEASSIAAGVEAFGALESTTEQKIVVDSGEQTIRWSGSITDGSDWPDVVEQLQAQLPAEWEPWTQQVDFSTGGILIGDRPDAGPAGSDR